MKGHLLLIDGTVRREASRTKRLMSAAEERLRDRYDIETLCLDAEQLRPYDNGTFKVREQLICQGRLDSPEFRLARQFCQADAILLAAPFWDFSFPAMVRTYLEHISICGLTFQYGEKGDAIGLCKARWLLYVTTAGGYIGNQDLGFSYLSAMAERFGIPVVRRAVCEGLDIAGADVSTMMDGAVSALDALLAELP